MSDAGRKVVHDLVEELPEEELPEIRSLLEERVRRRAEATAAKSASPRVKPGQPPARSKSAKVAGEGAKVLVSCWKPPKAMRAMVVYTE